MMAKTVSATKPSAGKLPAGIAEPLRILAVCLLAFLGSYLTLPQMGAWATLPFLLVCAVLCAFVRTHTWFKLLMFAVFSCFLYTFFNADFQNAVWFTVLCTGTALLAELSVALFRRKKLAGIFSGLVLLAAVCAGVFLLNGSPFTAFSAQSELNDYLDEHYNQDDIITEGLHYDRESGLFCMTLAGKGDPTNRRNLYYEAGRPVDYYLPYLESSLMMSRRLELQLLLRNAFPNDTFYAAAVGIAGFPEGKTGVSDTRDYTAQMIFTVGIPTDEPLSATRSRMEQYFRAALAADFTASRINFQAGALGKYTVQLSLRPVSIPQNLTFTPLYPDDFTRACTQNLFARFLISAEAGF